MAGFSSVTGDESIMFADNVSFDGTQRGGKVTTDGQLLIGSTTSPHIKVGTLTSAGATISITPGSGTINLEAGATMATTYDADTGSATPALNILTVAGGTGIATTGAGSTITIDADGAVPLQFDTDSGSAVPAANVITIAGAGGVSTSGAGATVTVTAGATIATTYTADSGTATPAANNINILGGPGVTTSATGDTVTINSVTFTDNSGTFTAAVDNGYFLTAASTVTLPASPAQGEVVRIICDTTSSCVITANTGQTIRINNNTSSTPGTATNTAQGDALWLVYRSTGAVWIAESSVGIWSLA